MSAFTMRLDRGPTIIVVSITGSTATREAQHELVEQARAKAAYRLGKPVAEMWVSGVEYDETSMMVAFEHYLTAP